MKRSLILISSALCFSVFMQAQTLDSAYFQCLYKLTYMKDLLRPGRIKTEDMMLLAGNNTSMFYSQTIFTKDSLEKADPAEYKPQLVNIGKRMKKLIPPRTKVPDGDNYECYFITPEKNEIICTSKVIINYYEYKEKLINPVWKITADTIRVLSYTCQKATTRYGGRNWTVWFAPEIAISEGPWKLRGLPGLILKAEDSKKHYVFECTGLARLKNKKPMVKDTEKSYHTLSKKEFRKMDESVFNNPLGEDVNASPEERSFRREYNPIELDK